jgi:hypothetical protein
MPMTNQYVVKITRDGYYSSIVYAGTIQECESAAEKLNAYHQTDTYRIEKYDPEKAFK